MTAEFDIRAEADRVIALLQQRRARDGSECRLVNNSHGRTAVNGVC